MLEQIPLPQMVRHLFLILILSDHIWEALQILLQIHCRESKANLRLAMLPA
jgi:hypothetical protein